MFFETSFPPLNIASQTGARGARGGPSSGYDFGHCLNIF